MQIICLHGFLGTSRDWQFLQHTALSPDLFNSGTPLMPFMAWADAFYRTYLQGTPSALLIGYSLGGRLAMHLVSQYPHSFAGAVIISAHSGLSCDKEKAERLKDDEEWAKLFENERWDHVMEKWNRRTVFSPDETTPDRYEKDYKKERLAEGLRTWSLGNQNDLKAAMEKTSVPLLWVAGEYDVKYRAVAEEMRLSHPDSQVWIAKESGHRVPWQQPERLRQSINTFIKSIEGVLQFPP